MYCTVPNKQQVQVCLAVSFCLPGLPKCKVGIFLLLYFVQIQIISCWSVLSSLLKGHVVYCMWPRSLAEEAVGAYRPQIHKWTCENSWAPPPATVATFHFWKNSSSLSIVFHILHETQQLSGQALVIFCGNSSQRSISCLFQDNVKKCLWANVTSVSVCEKQIIEWYVATIR